MLVAIAMDSPSVLTDGGYAKRKTNEIGQLHSGGSLSAQVSDSLSQITSKSQSALEHMHDNVPSTICALMVQKARAVQMLIVILQTLVALHHP